MAGTIFAVSGVTRRHNRIAANMFQKLDRATENGDCRISIADSARTATPGSLELSLGRVLRLYARAARLRCPHCGGGPVVASWFRMHPRCGACGLRTERGEEDFFLGAMMFNLVLSEGLLALCLVVLIVATWPRVPWDFLQGGAVVLMAAAPFLFYPFSKTIWLATDLLMRPVTPAEMAWHHENEADAIRPFVDR